jgi:hypothetical protein
MLISVPNGVFTTASQGRVLKREGMVAGAADLLLLLPRGGYGCLCIEMKTEKGYQRESQKVWQAQAEKNGNKYVIIRSFDDFMQTVNDYIGEHHSDLETLQNIIKQK